MTFDSDVERQISAALLRLRLRAPFFATLALFTRITLTEELETAATDGSTVFVNPAYFETLLPAEQDHLLLHRVLHAALLHVSRSGTRDAELWNVACDIVVNGIIAQIEGMRIPPGALRDERREQYGVEELYELLRQDDQRTRLTLNDPDLLDHPPGAEQQAPGGSEDDTIASGRHIRLANYWRQASEHAQVVSLGVAQGRLPAALLRELGALSSASLDWRAYLWRYLVQTPTDFAGFDRRLIGRGLYLDALESQSLRVYVAVDTSGSVSERQIRALVSEVQGILRAYPHITCELFYADARVYGPYSLSAEGEIPRPIGGGGTDFRPFFNAVEARHSAHEQALCIYLTDGFGDFPEHTPILPVLWVVTAGGRRLEKFPFGEAVRLLSDGYG